MEMIIESVTIVTRSGVKTYTVGTTVNGRTVHEIKDRTLEYEDGIVFIYHVLDADNNLIAAIENCPVEVVYFPPV